MSRLPPSPMAMPGAAPPPKPDENDHYWGRKLVDFIRTEGTDPDILHAFEELCDSAVPRIPEPYFQKILLPLSYIEPNVEKDVLVWRRLLGSFTSPVHVIGTKGEILYTAPGLFPEMPLYRDDKGRTLNWAQLSDTAIRKNNIHPALGEEQLYQVGSRYLPDISPEVAAKHREQWETIWKRYGVAGHAAVDAAAEPATIAAPILEALEEEDEV